MVLLVGHAICEASRNLYATRNGQGWQPDAEPLGGGGAVMRICMEEGVSTDLERRSGRIRNEYTRTEEVGINSPGSSPNPSFKIQPYLSFV